MLVVDVPALLARLGIEAKKRGREWWACCPFHPERTPSWQIRDDDEDPERHGRWRCLGKCHVGGGAVGLVMRVLELQRAREALDWLRSGGAVDRPSAGQEAAAGGGLVMGPAKRPKSGFVLPGGVRFVPFDEWPETARGYAESRGLNAEQVDRWGLGYAVDGRLRGRIVMPWRDGRGRLGGYTGRAYLPGDPRKYLEPTAEEGAGVGWVYGEELWPPPAERDELVVIEGGFDGYAIERATSLPWGAARGSHLTPGHVARISTFRRIVIATDPDGAGEKFAKSIADALARSHDGMMFRVSYPRDSDDAAKVERRDGPEALARAVAQAAPYE
jgi:DNA primase